MSDQVSFGCNRRARGNCGSWLVQDLHVDLLDDPEMETAFLHWLEEKLPNLFTSRLEAGYSKPAILRGVRQTEVVQVRAWLRKRGVRQEG